MHQLHEKKHNNLIFIIWAISVIGLFTSLYFSEIRQFEPCTLCWYQRILLYPLTVIMGIAYVRKDDAASLYSMVFTGLGTLVALYQYSIQTFDFLKDSAGFCGAVSCTEIHISWFGFITIPLLSFGAFLVMFILSIIVWKTRTRE